MESCGKNRPGHEYSSPKSSLATRQPQEFAGTDLRVPRQGPLQADDDGSHRHSESQKSTGRSQRRQIKKKGSRKNHCFGQGDSKKSSYGKSYRSDGTNCSRKIT